MKKTMITLVAVLSLMLSGCGMGFGTGMGTGTGSGTGGGLGDILGGIFGGANGANTAQSVLDWIIGGIKIDQRSLVGTWQYSSPGCAFTSQNALAKAGSAVAVGQIKDELQSTYARVGINSANTYFIFTEDNRFEAKVDGIPFSGTYTYDTNNSAIKMKSTFFSTRAYVTRTTNGIGLMFESKKLLTLLQGATALIGSVTGSQTISTIGELSKHYDGVRLGFDLSRYN